MEHQGSMWTCPACEKDRIGFYLLAGTFLIVVAAIL